MNKRLIFFGSLGVFFLITIILFITWLCLPVTILVGDEISSVLSGGDPSNISLFWDSFKTGGRLVYVSGDINSVEESIKKYQPSRAVLAFTRMQIISTLRRASENTKFFVVCYSISNTQDSADVVIYPDAEKIYQALVQKAGKNTPLVIYDAIGIANVSQTVRSESVVSQGETALEDVSVFDENYEEVDVDIDSKKSILAENSTFVSAPSYQIINDSSFFDNLEEKRPVAVISTIKTNQWPSCVRWICDVSFYQMAIQGLKKNKEEQSCFLGILPTIKAIFF